MYIEKKICKTCKHEFALKRSNQIFCSSKCRSRFHNKNNRMESERFPRYVKTLKRDFNILHSLMDGKDFVYISNLELRRKGFSFSTTTHRAKLNGVEKDVFGLLDYCFYKSDDNTYKIYRAS